jgi:leucine dehydrogenase
MWNYASEKAALLDALRLSRGMTYKAAISGLNLGGGKAIIIGDSSTQKSEKLLRRFGKFMNNLGGKYITGEDVGMTPKDMEYVRMETKYVVGVPEHMGGSGDPSPITAYGIIVGMKASLKHLTGKDSLEKKKISIQGLGHVGEHLLQLLQKEKAEIIVTDINEERVSYVTKKYKVKSVKPSEIYKQNVDIFAPCALGAIINNESIAELKCQIIAGSANNQLADELYHGNLLREKGILYAPDFLINAGGLINVASEMNGYNYKHVIAMVDNIYSVCSDIFNQADKENISTAIIAKQMAEERIKNIKEIKQGI